MMWQFWKNPVMVREVRTRMRGNRAFMLMTTHLVILSIVTGLAYLFFQLSLQSYSSLEQQRSFSRALFGLLVLIELLMISFLTPALTSGMVTGERERQTFDLLRVTLISPRSIILGKYSSALAFVILLVLTTLPLQSPAFIIGGVLPEEILIAILILFTTAITFSAFGIFFSSLLSRTLTSTILSYAVAFFLVFGIPLIAIIFIILFGSAIGNTFDDLSPSSLIPLVYLLWIVASLTPLPTIIATEVFILQQQSAWFVEIPIKDGVSLRLLSPWMIHIIFYLTISLILLWASIRLANRTER